MGSFFEWSDERKFCEFRISKEGGFDIDITSTLFSKSPFKRSSSENG